MNKKLVFLCLSLLSIFILNVNGGSVGLGHDFDETTKISVISDMFGLNKLAEVRLVSNMEQCLVSCEAVISIIPNSESPSELVEDYEIRFKNVLGELENLSSVRYYRQVDRSIVIEVNDYGICLEDRVDGDKNSTRKIEYNCQTGTHNETRNSKGWDLVELTPELFKKTKEGDEIVLKVLVEKDRGKNIDWLPKFYGEEISELAWFNTSWNNKIQVNITENGGTTRNDYAVKLQVNFSTGMNTNYSDLRFLNYTETGELSYWIESYNNTYATVWLKVPLLQASNITSVYMYYNNPTALTTSNGVNTFLFFEDFETNLNQWTNTSTATITGGTVELDSAGEQIINTKKYDSNHLRYRALIKMNETTKTHSWGLANNTNDPDGLGGRDVIGSSLESDGTITMLSRTEGASTSTGSGAGGYSTSETVFEILRDDFSIVDSVNWTRNDVQITNGYHTTNNPQLPTYLQFEVNTGGGRINVNWTFISNYTKPEPSAVFGVSQVVPNTSPTIPFLVTPINGTYFKLNDTFFSWGNSSDVDGDAINYSIEVANDSGFILKSFVNYAIVSGCCNRTNVSSVFGDGYYYWRVWARDNASGSLNSSYSDVFVFIVDTMLPTVNFSSPTLEGGVFRGVNSILVNTTLNETYFANITFNLYNLTVGNNLVNSSFYSSRVLFINFSGLVDNTYFYNVSVSDLAGNSNFSVTRNITLDTVLPTVLFDAQLTNVNGVFRGVNSFLVNVSVNETNFANITFNLYNLTVGVNLVNSSNYSSRVLFINFSGLVDNVYYYNVSVSDLAGNSNFSVTRNITLDTVFPVIVLSSPLIVNGSFVRINNLTFSAILTDLNPSNFSFSIHNTSSLYFGNSSLLNYSCYQETANQSNANDGVCGLSYSGVYNFSSGNMFDGDFNTGSLVSFTSYVNYTKPPNVVSAFSEVKFSSNNLIVNHSIVSGCLSGVNNILQLRFRTGSCSGFCIGTRDIGECFDYNNGSLGDWDIFKDTFGNDVGDTFFEEAVVWNLNLNSGNNSFLNSTLHSMPDGLYVYNFSAFDSAGNFNRTVSFSLFVDTVYPLVSYQGSSFSSDANSSVNSFSVNVSVSELNFANISFSLYNTTNGLTLVNGSNYSSQTFFINYSSLNFSVSYYYNVSVFDLAGNLNFTVTRSIGFDRTNPNISIISPLNNSIIDGNTVFYSLVGSDDFSGLSYCYFNVSLGGSPSSLMEFSNTNYSCAGSTGSFSLSAVSGSSHSLNVCGNDTAGNTNCSSRTFIISTTIGGGGGSAGAGGGSIVKEIFESSCSNKFFNTRFSGGLSEGELGIRTRGGVVRDEVLEVYDTKPNQDTVLSINVLKTNTTVDKDWVSLSSSTINLHANSNERLLIPFKVSIPKSVPDGNYYFSVATSGGVSDCGLRVIKLPLIVTVDNSMLFGFINLGLVSDIIVKILGSGVNLLLFIIVFVGSFIMGYALFSLLVKKERRKGNVLLISMFLIGLFMFVSEYIFIKLIT